MKKEDILKKKEELGAKHCWVDDRYNNRVIFLYSDNQKETLISLLEKDGCLVDENFQRVCNDDRKGLYTVDEIKDVYYGYNDDE